jgi:hypothetical protein
MELLQWSVLAVSHFWLQSQVVMVLQKGAYRKCVDYRPVNSCSTRINFPIPIDRHTFQYFKNKKIFSLLDNRKGYNQIPLTERAMKYTTFFTPFGAYMYTRVPFGLVNAPAYYNYLMITIVLVGLITYICVCYFDDTVVFSNDYERHLQDLVTVLQRFSDKRLTLNGPKCQIAVLEVLFWGHLCDGSGYNHIESRRQQALSYPRPTTKKQLERFIGLAVYFSSHIPMFAILRKRLTSIVHGPKLVYTDDAIAAFNELRDKMFNSVKLYFPDYSLPLHLVVDGSKSGFGGHIYQARPTTSSDPSPTREIHEPLGFVSLAYNDVQSRWQVDELEAFAVYFCVMYFSWILRGVHFYLHTDHKNLTYIRETPSPKVQRWCLRLMEFLFSISHIPGATNIADPLSRAHESSPTADTSSAMVQVQTRAQTARYATPTLQLDQPTASTSMRSSQLKSSSSTPNDLSAYQLPTIDDMPASLQPKHRTIPCPTVDTSSIPPDEYQAIIRCHNATVSGHRGLTATIRLLKQLGISFKHMRSKVAMVIHSCPLCQKIWLHQTQPRYRPSTIEVYEPFRVLGSDFIGPLPRDRHGNEYIHVITCQASRYTYLFAARSPTAEQVATDLVFIFSHHDLCHELHSDRGSAYIAKVTDCYCKLLNIEHSFNIPYRSQQNSITERMNKSVEHHARALVYTDQDTLDAWSELLPLITRLLNTTYHSTLHSTPSALVWGRYFTESSTLFPGSDKPSSKSLRERYDKMLALQEKLLRQSQIFQAAHSDLYIEQTSPVAHSDIFAVDSLVLVTYPDRAPDKLKSRLRGPFRVMAHYEDDVYVCINLVNGQSLEFHVSQLRPYTNDINPTSLTPLQVAMRDKEEYIIDCLLDHRVIARGSINKRSHLEFLVAWLGYGPEFYSWEPYSNLKDTIAMQDYVESTKELAYLV